MNTSAKKQIIPELLAAVLWGILTLWTDRLFFRYDWRTTAFFVYKALFVLLAFLLVHGIVTLVKKLRAKDRFVWRWLQWTLPYLAVNLIVLLIVWPGCWGRAGPLCAVPRGTIWCSRWCWRRRWCWCRCCVTG